MKARIENAPHPEHTEVKFEVKATRVAGYPGMELVRQHPLVRGGTTVQRGYWLLTYKGKCIREKSRIGAEIMCVTLYKAVENQLS